MNRRMTRCLGQLLWRCPCRLRCLCCRSGHLLRVASLCDGNLSGGLGSNFGNLCWGGTVCLGHFHGSRCGLLGVPPLSNCCLCGCFPCHLRLALAAGPPREVGRVVGRLVGCLLGRGSLRHGEGSLGCYRVVECIGPRTSWAAPLAIRNRQSRATSLSCDRGGLGGRGRGRPSLLRERSCRFRRALAGRGDCS